MPINNQKLISELRSLNKEAVQKVNAFKSLSEDTLRRKKDDKTWSVLECIEHLNLYGDYYLPEMERCILQSAKRSGVLQFKPGLIGDYFAKLMKGKDGKISKMQSPKDKNPGNSDLSPLVLDRFLKQAEQLEHLLNHAEHTDLTATKASISISRIIKLRLGDTFRFYVYHMMRHIAQAERAVVTAENMPQ